MAQILIIQQPPVMMAERKLCSSIREAAKHASHFSTVLSPSESYTVKFYDGVIQKVKGIHVKPFIKQVQNLFFF